jgi:hypothetical protein
LTLQSPILAGRTETTLGRPIKNHTVNKEQRAKKVRPVHSVLRFTFYVYDEPDSFFLTASVWRRQGGQPAERAAMPALRALLGGRRSSRPGH